ncbi:MAG: hypothetical protein LBO70_04035 [Clostridiales Family XIII bacterium]|jgi:hypothetical protein|nr:hypothetical protein [Clostridiales Family XIII bacterium]
MLTIGEPIKPNTGRTFTTITPSCGEGVDFFYERIAGGYALMSMNFTPNDMLLLMFASPDIMEFGGGGTNISEIANITNSRGFLLNIVNNVLNRVLLVDNDEFLYRDEVYIANVLRRMGVTDVNYFLKEATAVIEESKTALRLVEHYSRNADLLRETRIHTGAAAPGGVDGTEGTASVAIRGEREPGADLFSEIFQRHYAGSIFSILQSYGAYETGERVSDALELNASEWVGVWNAVNLFDNRKGFTVSEFSPVHRHYNAYETGVALSPSAEGSEVVGSAVAAALINIAQNALLSRLGRTTHTDAHVRVDVSHVFPVAAGPTLERFRSWHSERVVGVFVERIFERRLSELDRLEEKLLSRIETERAILPPPAMVLREDADSYGERSESALTERIEIRDESHYIRMFSHIKKGRSRIERLMKLAGSATGRDMFRQFIKHTDMSETSSREIREVAMIDHSPGGGRAVGDGEASGDLYRPESNLSELIFDLIERSTAEPIGIEADGGLDTDRVAELYLAQLAGADEEAEGTLGERLKAGLDEYDRKNKEIAEKLANKAETPSGEAETEKPQAPDVERRTAIEALAGLEDSERLLMELRETDAKEKRERPAPELTLLAQLADTDEEVGAAIGERLKTDLDEYDRRNKELARKLAESTQDGPRRYTSEGPQPPGSENRMAIEALAGLEDSGKLLKELREADSTEKRERVAPKLTHLLSSLPPERREIYERLLSETQGMAGGEDGVLRPVSLPELNAEILAAVREHTEAGVHSIEKEIKGGVEVLRDHVARTIERTEIPLRGRKAGDSAHPYEAPRLLHRQEGPAGLSADGLARPESAESVRTDREVTIRENIVREEQLGTEINRAVKDMEVKALRDIDSAISRALAGQMRMIESRIYSGVERKLDMERARRGK